MVRLSLTVDENTWKQLRLLAEVNRTRGRASVADIVRQAIRQLIARTPVGSSRRADRRLRRLALGRTSDEFP